MHGFTPQSPGWARPWAALAAQKSTNQEWGAVWGLRGGEMVMRSV